MTNDVKLLAKRLRHMLQSSLSRFHSDFVNPSPMGPYGDGGCDGLADSGAISMHAMGRGLQLELIKKQTETRI